MRLLHHKKISQHLVVRFGLGKTGKLQQLRKSNFLCFFFIKIGFFYSICFDRKEAVLSSSPHGIWVCPCPRVVPPFPLRVTDALLEQIGYSDMEWFMRSPDPFAQRTYHSFPQCQKLPRIPREMCLHRHSFGYKQNYLVTMLCHLLPFKMNRCYFCSQLNYETSSLFFKFLFAS